MKSYIVSNICIKRNKSYKTIVPNLTLFDKLSNQLQHTAENNTSAKARLRVKSIVISE